MQNPPRIPWNDYKARIQLACSGWSCVADIPKVVNAGQLEDRDGVEWQVMFNGLRMRAGGYYGGWMTELIRNLKGHHEPQEERVFHDVLEQLDAPHAMLELGAYWAWYSLWFKSRFPGATAIAAEPSPANLAIAAANAAENKLDLAMELGGVAGSQNRVGDSFRITPHCLVPCLTVEDLMRKHGLERLDILHADIQGAELAMLGDARPLLNARKIDHLFISTHGDKIHADCRALLLELGYRIIAEHTSAESFSIDGLIAARSPILAPLEVSISRRSTHLA